MSADTARAIDYGKGALAIIKGMSVPVVGYVRVSTDKQDISPEVQRAGLTAAADREGLELVLVEELGVSAATIAHRPKLLGVLDGLKARQYSGLMVYSLDRLSRSLEDGARVLADSQRQRWRLICLDLNVDTASIMGAAMFGMALTYAEVERRQIGKRTREAMAAKTAAGAHMGRPRTLPMETVARIVALRESGATYRAIAEVLIAEEMPTATNGGAWSVSKVQSVLKTRTAAQIRGGAPVTVPTTAPS